MSGAKRQDSKTAGSIFFGVGKALRLVQNRLERLQTDFKGLKRELRHRHERIH
jgi:hypothetical protein